MGVDTYAPMYPQMYPQLYLQLNFGNETSIFFALYPTLF